MIPDQSNKEYISFRLPEIVKDPVLNAAVSETLRLQANGLLMRMAEHDTSLTVNGKIYAIREGESVIVSMATVHKNPQFYDSPYDFRLERFLDDEQPKALTDNGRQARKPYLWWGGGAYMVSLLFLMLTSGSAVAADSQLQRLS